MTRSKLSRIALSLTDDPCPLGYDCPDKGICYVIGACQMSARDKRCLTGDRQMSDHVCMESSTHTDAPEFRYLLLLNGVPSSPIVRTAEPLMDMAREVKRANPGLIVAVQVTFED